MRKIYLTLLLSLTFNIIWSQSENCSGAVTLTNGSCVVGTAGLSQNIVGCVGNADDDAWYKFVATGTSHSLTVTGSATYDAVLQVFSGPCSSLISSACVDNSFNGLAESTVVSGLTIGNTYYVRVYHYGVGSGSSTFTMCLNNPPAAPANDACVNAISLTVNAGCTNTNGTTFGATQSLIGCAGTANDDVWYSFTATNYTQTIQVTGSASMDAVVELYNGSCASLTSMSCTDNSFSGGTETVIATGLNPGATYFFRVYDYYSGSGSSFSVCVSGTSIIAGSQPNDEPCNAIQIPAVTAECNNLTFSNVGATATSSPGNPGNVCENYNNPTNTYVALSNGGWGATTKDVWFRITVPASGNIYITPSPNQGAGWIQDGTMTLYRGTCSSLTTYTCSDDYNFPAGYNDLQPFIRATGLTPGETVYLRYWGYGSAQGNFGFCVQSPTNDLCANALYICDINGYSATTSPAYTRDHPCNMRGNGEGPGPTYTYSVGANPAGPFGAGGSWGVGSTLQDVYIDNNSWVKFTAASPTVSLRVTVYNCWGVGTNSVTATPGTPRGVQMQIFSTSSACCGFVPVSDYKENGVASFVGGVSTYTLNANSLTIGNNYYVMVDGWSGDICNYNIQAIAGVAFPAITSVPGTICPGNSSILTAPSGATGYTWAPTGENTQTISVSPGTQMTYTCYVGGVCGYKQTLTKTVFLYTTPTVSINAGAPITTCGTQAITLTGSGASTYSWSTGNTTSSYTVAPSSNTTYTVIGTSANGCTNTAVSTVTVNTIPSVTVSSVSNTICIGSNTNLTVGGANTYVWSPSASLSASTGTAVIATPTITTNYTVIGTAANGCTNSAVYKVNVNSKPTISSTTTGSVICNGTSITLNGTGANTYTWTGGVNNGVAFTPTATSTYTVSGTDAVTGCTNTAVRTITVNSIPTTTANTSGTITCATHTVNLNSSLSGQSYTWTPPSGSSIFSGTNSQNAIGQGSGTYTLLIMSPAGCTNTTTLATNINTTTPSASAVGGTLTCAQTSTILVGGPTSGVTYSWAGPGILGSNTSANITATVVGSYSLTTTSTINGCSSSSVAIATVTNNLITPTVTAGSTQTITCAAPTVTLTGSATAGSNLSWSSGSTTNTTTVGGSGIYTLTATSPVTGCSATSTVQVVPSAGTPSGTLGIISNSITCTNTIVAVSITSTTTPISITWSGTGIVGSTNTPSTTVSQGGTYTVTITNTSNSCSQSYPVVVPTNTAPVVASASIAPNASITCNTSSVTLSSTPTGANYNYSWSGPNIISGGNTANPIVGASGNYSVIVTNSITGCTNALGSAVVFVPTNSVAPTLSLSANSITTTCGNPSATVTVTSNSNPNTTYTWTPPTTGNVSNTSISNPTIGGTGVFTVTVSNTINGCVSAIGTLTLVPDVNLPTFNLSSNTATINCAISSPSVSLSSTVTPVTYSWNPTPSTGATSANATFTATGNYTCTITNTSNGCSTNAAQVAVVINTTAPTVSATVTNTTITCSNSSSTITVLSPGNTLTWTTPSGASASNPLVATTPGDYEVTVTDAINGCTTTQTITIVSDIVSPDANAGSATVMPCNSYTTILLGTSTTTDAVSFSWNGPSASSITSGANTATPLINATGVYTLTVTNLVTGCSATSTVDVSTDNVTAGFDADPMFGEIPLTVNFTNTSVGATNYSWTFGNGSVSTSTNPTTVFNDAGTYTVMLVASSNLCSDTVTKIIIAEEGFTLEVPNVFTPNGDGANDIFYVKSTGVKSAEGYIYNRWGQLLFSWDVLKASWDGKGSNGENCPDGTYYYIIKLIDKKDKEHLAPGYVLIAR